MEKKAFWPKVIIHEKQYEKQWGVKYGILGELQMAQIWGQGRGKKEVRNERASKGFHSNRDPRWPVKTARNGVPVIKLYGKTFLLLKK